MHRTGLCPPRAGAGAVRWVAIQHAADHVHIVALLARQDGRQAPALAGLLPGRRALPCRRAADWWPRPAVRPDRGPPAGPGRGGEGRPQPAGRGAAGHPAAARRHRGRGRQQRGGVLRAARAGRGAGPAPPQHPRSRAGHRVRDRAGRRYRPGRRAGVVRRRQAGRRPDPAQAAGPVGPGPGRAGPAARPGAARTRPGTTRRPPRPRPAPRPAGSRGTPGPHAGDIAWAAADVLRAAAAVLGSPALRLAADAYDRAARAPWGRLPPPSPAGSQLRAAARLVAAAAHVTRDRPLAHLAFLIRMIALIEAVAELPPGPAAPGPGHRRGRRGPPAPRRRPPPGPAGRARIAARPRRGWRPRTSPPGRSPGSRPGRPPARAGRPGRRGRPRGGRGAPARSRHGVQFPSPFQRGWRRGGPGGTGWRGCGKAGQPSGHPPRAILRLAVQPARDGRHRRAGQGHIASRPVPGPGRCHPQKDQGTGRAARQLAVTGPAFGGLPTWLAATAAPAGVIYQAPKAGPARSRHSARRPGFAATGRSGNSHRGKGATSTSAATTYRPAAVTAPARPSTRRLSGRPADVDAGKPADRRREPVVGADAEVQVQPARRGGDGERRGPPRPVLAGQAGERGDPVRLAGMPVQVQPDDGAGPAADPGIRPGRPSGDHCGVGGAPAVPAGGGFFGAGREREHGQAPAQQHGQVRTLAVTVAKFGSPHSLHAVGFQQEQP